MNNVLAIYASHDASVCAKIGDEYRIFEIERFTKKRYQSLNECENYEQVYQNIFDLIKNEFGVTEFEHCLIKHIPDAQKEFIQHLWTIKTFEGFEHHPAHAACSFFQSDFDEALAITFDGGGRDEAGNSFFNMYHIKDKKIELLHRFKADLGGAYTRLALPISEIKKIEGHPERLHLAFAGKVMGLVAYGEPRKQDMAEFLTFYSNLHTDIPLNDVRRLKTSFHMDANSLQGQESYDLAATSQLAFEEVVLLHIEQILDLYPNLPICLSGGCALNVLFNERLRRHSNRDIFIPPNPNDTGLSFGAVTQKFPPETKADIVYNGYPILDEDKLEHFVDKYNGKKTDFKEITELLNEGKIIGVVRGKSECGPRALGNRSIICDPSFIDMKDTLNEKVKFREWFRPFAPVVKIEKCSEYFDFDGESRYMSFAPNVKEEWRDKIPSIVHEDNTARVQTVTEEQHSWFYNLLSEFEKNFNKGVLLNTSFNIKGKPILTTIEDALNVLHTTELDCVVVNDFIFKKGENE